jgi:cytochrome c oxidase cbb3-type subunit III
MLGKFFSKKFLRPLGVLAAALISGSPAWAAGPPAENPLNNPFAILLISVMIILLIAIGILANILIGAADITLIKWKKKEVSRKSTAAQVAAIFIGFMLLNISAFAQNAPDATPASAAIGGLTPSVFYTLVTIIFLELLVILVLLINIRMLLKSQKESLVVIQTVTEVQPVVANKPRLSWWIRFNKFRTMEQEADIDLGHNYDGIRELDNRLPPWWIYGFYVTIVFAAIYLWRYHVSHSAPLSKEEYEIAVQKADQKVQDYLKQKGESVDENNVAMLGSPDVAEGKRMFQISCIACHNEGGAGNVGPNLTDDYWLHGADIKSVFKTIKYGINAMPTWQNTYNNKQIAQLSSYVKSLRGTNPPNAKAPQGDLYKDDASAPKPAADSTATKKERKVAMN